MTSPVLSISSIPRFIYFTGVDGSGKSTYVDLLIKEFEKRGFKAKRVWLRFNYFLTKPVLFLCRLTGLTRRPARGGKRISVHEFYRAPLIGYLVQYLHFLDTCIYYFVKVYLPMFFSNTYILCDRFVYDILADLMIENRDLRLHNKTIGTFFRRLIPDKALVFYFKVDKQEIIRRKPQVLIDDEDYTLKYDTYCCLERDIAGEFIDNNQDITTGLDKILNRVFSEREDTTH